MENYSKSTNKKIWLKKIFTIFTLQYFVFSGPIEMVPHNMFGDSC